jgi:hypothetical protein
MENKRPILVTIICILQFMGVPFSILGSLLAPVFAPIINQIIPGWYTVFEIVFTIFYLVCLIFIWKMRRRALICYTTLVILDCIVTFLAGFGSYFILSITIIILGLLWTQFKKMS